MNHPSPTVREGESMIPHSEGRWTIHSSLWRKIDQSSCTLRVVKLSWFQIIVLLYHACCAIIHHSSSWGDIKIVGIITNMIIIERAGITAPVGLAAVQSAESFQSMQFVLVSFQCPSNILMISSYYPYDILAISIQYPYKIPTICQWDVLSTNDNGVRSSPMKMGCSVHPYPFNILMISFWCR